MSNNEDGMFANVLFVEPDDTTRGRSWAVVRCPLCGHIHRHDITPHDRVIDRPAHCTLRLGAKPVIYAIDLRAAP